MSAATVEPEIVDAEIVGDEAAAVDLTSIPRGLLRTLLIVACEVGPVPRDSVSESGDSYASADDYLRATRGAMLKHGLLVVPETLRVRTSASGADVVSLRYAIVHAPTGEHMALRWMARASGEHAVTAAQAVGLRSLLRTLLMLPPAPPTAPPGRVGTKAPPARSVAPEVPDVDPVYGDARVPRSLFEAVLGAHGRVGDAADLPAWLADHAPDVLGGDDDQIPVDVVIASLGMRKAADLLRYLHKIGRES